MKIAIDAMGGDLAPQATVAGTLLAAADFPDTEYILVGRTEAIRAQASQFPANVTIVHAEDVIDPGAEPVKSVRRQKDSSLVVCTNLVRDGQADAMVSAGNTGAFMVAGLLVVGRMPGIDRPALAAMLPTFSGRGILLVDAGANTDCEATHLLQFAKMGQAYMRLARGVDPARVALLNIGTEPSKGNELCKSAYGLLKEEVEHFVGNVESRELLGDVCDVVVCDGFVGNTLLKFYEGAGGGFIGALRDLFTKSLLGKLAALALRSELRGFRRRFDYVEAGGSPFLGVRGILVKAHGASNARAFQVALRQARAMGEADLMTALAHEL
ncbi:MAG: phosphate acyltransferase PlsX [Firmicutes bacterium]|nr:phosphate acyltransferase PlsX [Bacillota bacterium]